MEKKKNILYLSSWYPNHNDPTLGIFVRRHALSASQYCTITVVHASSSKNCIQAQTQISESEIKEVIIHYPKSKINWLFIGRLIDQINYIKYTLKGIGSTTNNIRDYDLVQVNIAFPVGIIALLLKWFYGLSYILLEHWTGYLPSDGNYLKSNWLKKRIIKSIVKNAKAVITVSEDLRNEMLSHKLKNKYYIISNVVDQKIFYPPHQLITSSTNQLINKSSHQLITSSANQQINILHVSTLNDKQKNINGIIQAAEKLKNESLNFVLHIVGDGPEKKQYEQLCEQKNLLPHHVKFYGLKTETEIAELMRNAHFLLLFSNYENLPCVMLEAMMCGLPIISTNVGDISRHITIQNGILIHPKNEEELLIAIKNMMRNYSLSNRYSIAKYAEERFSMNVVGEKFRSIYQNSPKI